MLQEDEQFPASLFRPRMNSQTSTSEGMDLPKSQRKTLESLGHVWTKFYQAQQILLKRAKKGQLSASLAPWLAFAPEFMEAKGSFEPSFVLRVKEVETAEGLTCYLSPVGITTEQEISKIESSLAEKFQGESPAIVPAIMNAPVWSALLRLHELKTFWIQELRQNHYEALLQWLPEAWLYTQVELPPGTTIARLGKRNWSSVIESGVLLERADAQQVGEVVPMNPRVLEEAIAEKHVFRRAGTSKSRDLAVLYRHQNGKTQLAKVMPFPASSFD